MASFGSSKDVHLGGGNSTIAKPMQRGRIPKAGQIVVTWLIIVT
jgi:hypothetical protein